MSTRFLKDLLTYLPAKLLPALTAFITVPIVTRLLTPAEYGDYALAIGVSDFLFAMTCSGLGAGAVRFYAAYQAADRLGAFFKTLGVALLIAIGSGGLMALIVLAIIGRTLSDALLPLMVVSILVFVVQAIYIVLMQVVRAQERSRLYTAFELLTGYGSLIIGLLLLIALDWGASGLLWGMFIAYAFGVIILLPQVKRAGPERGGSRWQADDLSGLWRYAWPLALGNLAMWGLRLSDRYLLGAFRSRTEVGLYSAAYNISGKSIDILVAVFLLSMGPLIINLWEKSGREAAQRALQSTTRIFLLLGLPAAAGLSALAAPFVALLTDAPYHAGYQIVAYVVFARFLYGLGQIAGMGLLIAQHTRRIAVIQLVAAAANLGLNLMLIPQFGFVAAGATALIGYVVLFVWQAAAARSYLTWHFPYRTLRNVVMASIVTCLTAAGLYGWLNPAPEVNVLALLVAIAVAVVVYGASLCMVNEFTAAELAAIKTNLARMTHRSDLNARANKETAIL